MRKLLLVIIINLFCSNCFGTDNLDKNVVNINDYETTSIIRETNNKLDVIGNANNTDKPVYENLFAKYNTYRELNEGLMAVSKNDKWGFVDSQGNEICQIKYDSCSDFLNGFAIVEIKNQYGYIDKQGKEICKFKYIFCQPFEQNGFAKVMIMKPNREIESLSINTKGKEFRTPVIKKKKTFFEMLH